MQFAVMQFAVLYSISMVDHESQAVFENDSYFKSEFQFHVQFKFKN